MTKLESYNIMLMYINEEEIDITEATTPTLGITKLCKITLDESIRIFNAATGLTATIDTITASSADYVVKRASRALFTRHIGFEDKGLDVIAVEEKQALFGVATDCFNAVFGDILYNDVKFELITILASKNSIEELYLFASRMKSQLDELATTAGDNRYGLAVITNNAEEIARELVAFKGVSIDAAFPLDIHVRSAAYKIIVAEGSKDNITKQILSLTDRVDAITDTTMGLSAEQTKKYIINTLLLENGIQIGVEENARLLNMTRLASIATNITSTFFKEYALSKMKGTSLEECTAEAIAIQATITSLSGTNDTERMAELMLINGNNLPKEEQIRLARIVAKSYLATKIGIDYFKSYILENLTGLTVEEITAEVDSYEDTILAITAPTELDAESAFRYKIAVLKLNTNKIIDTSEKDRLTQSIVSTQVLITFALSKYDYIRSSIIELIDMSTVKSITDSITIVKSKIDAIVAEVNVLYPFIADNIIIYEYAFNKIMADKGYIATNSATSHTDASVYVTKEKYNLQSIASKVFNNIVLQGLGDIQTERVLLELPIGNMKLSGIHDIARAISTASMLSEYARKTVLSYGWHFNTIVTPLVPNVSGYIVVPRTFLNVESVSNSSTFLVRDWKLFDSEQSSFIFTEPVECSIIEDIHKDDLPQHMAEYVHRFTMLEVYKSIIGITSDMTFLIRQLSDAKIDAIRIDADNHDGNILSSTYATTLLDRTSL